MKKYTLIALVLLVSTLGFAQEGVLKYNTDPFTGVMFSSSYDVDLVQDDSSFVLIESEKLSQEDVTVEIVDGVLSLKFKNLYDDIEVEVHSPNYNFIQASGAVDVTAKTPLTGDWLEIKLSGATEFEGEVQYSSVHLLMSGSSDASLTGKADSLYVKASGASDLKATDLVNKYASLQGSGACDLYVNPSDVLLADLSGASSLQYKSEPATKKINESGSVWYGLEGEKQAKNDTLRLQSEGGEILIIGDYDLDDIEDIEDLEDIDVEKEVGEAIEKIRSKKKFKGNWAGFEFGLNGYMTPDYSIDMPAGYGFMELDYPKSYNFSFNPFQQSVALIGKQFGLVTGLGFRWNNYRFGEDVVIQKDSVFTGYNEGDGTKEYKKSKLTSVYVTVPLLLEFQTNHRHRLNSFHLSAGVIGGLRMMSHTKMIYKTANGGKVKPKTYDNFHLQPFILDATARIGWGKLNLYATYSLVEMFRDEKGPELYPFSVGFVLPF